MKRSVTLLFLLALLVASCTHPLNRTLEQALHEQLTGSNRAYLEALKPGLAIETSRPVSDVEAKLDEERRKELDAMSGPLAHEGRQLDLGPDLLEKEGEEAAPTIAMTLRRAIHDAVKNNLNIRLARLEPAVNETLITQAEAVFDATYFAEVAWSKLDTPRPPSPVSAALSSSQVEQTGFTTGIRKLMTHGGQISVQTGHLHDVTDPSSYTTDAAHEFAHHTANASVELTQPLLRNFGSDVNRSQIELAGNATAASVQDLKARLLELTVVTEQAYWQLVFARQRLLIQMQLLERTREDRDQIEARQKYDATPAQVTQARSTYQSHRAELIRARHDVRKASDALKRLINAPDLSVADESMIVPLDKPVDMPIKFSLLDSVASALANRPELKRSLLEIEDASIRQRVADNQRLPELSLVASVAVNGVGPSAGSAYGKIDDADFIDYIISGQFEMPLGNRQPEAAYRQRQLERRASVINYQRQAQDVVVEVKNALRDLQLNYELIGAERGARLAAAENLRALQELKRFGEPLTPEFLDLKLRREEALAASELRELQAMIDYNTAVASFYRTTGTLLEHNGIDFVE